MIAAALLASSMVIGSPAVPAPGESIAPNIVVILADDLGWSDLPSYGNSRLKTPNLDRLTQEGIRFTNFYAAAPICSPSRAGLLTGRDPSRLGLITVLQPGSHFILGAREQTVAAMLQKRGYATACIGKWHLGSTEPALPLAHGFQRFFGLPYSNDMLPLVLFDQGRIVESYPTRQQAMEVMPTLTRRLTERAVEFIRSSRDRPFFLYLSHVMPHNPVAASPAFVRHSRAGALGDTIEELDWSVGEVLGVLQELSLDRKTLVVFLSDNGVTRPKAVLRGGKFNFFEGGLRVPCIVRWTGTLRGRVENQPASILDWFPTFRHLVGAPDDGQTLDGSDLTALLLGTGARANQEFCWTNEAYRSGRWKLMIDRPRGRPPQTLLFDLESDPRESTDVSDQHPDIFARLAAALKTTSAARKQTR